MEKPSRLRHLHEQSQEQTSAQAAGHHSAATTPPALEFESPETLLRHDAAQTPAPPALASRIRESLAGEPAPRAPWWRRLLGRDRP